MGSSDSDLRLNSMFFLKLWLTFLRSASFFLVRFLSFSLLSDFVCRYVFSSTAYRSLIGVDVGLIGDRKHGARDPESKNKVT